MNNDMNKITNLAEMGLEGANLLGFLNKIGYSDCHSWLLVKEDGKLFAYEVERDFTPKYDGDNVYYCINNEAQRHAPIVLTGSKQEIIHRKVNGMSQFGKWIVETWLGEVLKTPTGRDKKKWVSFGDFRHYCSQFHDYNF